MEIDWNLGTAYDLFVSLRILHIPESFGLRPKWASGMRARLSNESRQTLSQAETLLFAKRPTHWLCTLPEPRDARTVLNELAQIPASDRLPLLVFHDEIRPDVQAVLRTVARQGRWDSSDLSIITSRFQWWTGVQPTLQEAAEMLELWSQASTFGDRYLAMLIEYYEAFFAEEERRLQPFLEQAQARAQLAFASRPFSTFLSEILSGGRQDTIPSSVERLTLAPSYWVSPHAFCLRATPQHMIVIYGARPPGASLVPGEAVPDMVVKALKALADSTRLRIMQQLTQAPATPTQLSHRLRLRTSTIGHHLKLLQVVGLVRVSKREGKEIQYMARHEDLEDVFQAARRLITAESSGALAAEQRDP